MTLPEVPTTSPSLVTTAPTGTSPAPAASCARSSASRLGSGRGKAMPGLSGGDGRALCRAGGGGGALQQGVERESDARKEAETGEHEGYPEVPRHPLRQEQGQRRQEEGGGDQPRRGGAAALQ